MSAYPQDVVEATARALYDAATHRFTARGHRLTDLNEADTMIRFRQRAIHALDRGYVPEGWGRDDYGKWSRIVQPDPVAEARRRTDEAIQSCVDNYDATEECEAVEILFGTIIDALKDLRAELRASDGRASS